MIKKEHLQTWVQIDKKAFVRNISELRKNIPKETKFLAVVKGNAYGHGFEEILKIMPQKGIDYLGVFDFSDALKIRKLKIKTPILVLKNIESYQIQEAIKNSIEVCVSSLETLKNIGKIKSNKKLKIHICVDTGLGRDGFTLEEIHKVRDILKSNKKIEIVGLFTHFSGAENRLFDSYTVMQVAFLQEWKHALKEIGITPMLHASATSGIFLSKEFSFDMVRFGIGIYGIWPSDETRIMGENKADLKPVLSWFSKISEVKSLVAGSYVGYDCTYRLPRDSKIAIVPIGYFDGYPRSASSKSSVLVGKERVRVIGRVMMNMIVLDVTDLKNVKEGDIVTLIGGDSKNYISVDDLADASNSINYEIVTRINPQIPRFIK